MALSKSQRATVFAMFDGHCAYCGIVLPEKGWHADHVEPVMRDWWFRSSHARWVERGKVGPEPVDRGMSYPERDKIENHFPACRACNLHKHACNLETWRRLLEQQVRMCRDYSAPFRHAERFGLVAVAETKVVFYFEKLRIEKEQ